MAERVTEHFWKDRRVLVTGHTGFKGAWLCLWLEQLGARIAGYSLAPPTEPSLFAAGRVEEGLDHRVADVRDAGTLAAAVEAAAPEVIFHLAAQSLVLEGYQDPLGTFATNVQGTANLLEAARRCAAVRAVVVVTTDKCYENREWPWAYRESDRLGGRDPYAASKAAAELVTASYRDSFLAERQLDGGPRPVAVASARAGNVIGGGDWAPHRLVPEVVEAVLDGRDPVLRRPGAIRPWQHVLEPLGAYLLLAEKLLGSREATDLATAWNFGPAEEEARPVAWIAERLVALAADSGADAGRPEDSWRQDPEAASYPHEATYLKLDTARARTHLGWHPRLDLETALAWTLEWFRAHRRGDDVRALCRDQIARYAALGAAPQP